LKNKTPEIASKILPQIQKEVTQIRKDTLLAEIEDDLKKLEILIRKWKKLLKEKVK